MDNSKFKSALYCSISIFFLFKSKGNKTYSTKNPTLLPIYFHEPLNWKICNLIINLTTKKLSRNTRDIICNLQPV